MPRPVALVSVAGARHLDTDLAPLVRALGDRGITAEVADWDDPGQDWGRFAAAVVRSTWDYHRRLEEFLDWVARVSQATALHNPAGVLGWNLDKTYLVDLESAGIPVVPTAWVRGAEDLVGVNDLIKGDVVVKPSVSAGSNNTLRHVNAPAAAAAHAMSLIDAQATVMVQPYQRFIDDNAETGLVYLDGTLSHAFRKGAILAGGKADNALFAEEEISARTANPAERELGEAVMGHLGERFGGPPLYARVDVVRGVQGAPVVMEVELAEPSLYLHLDPDSPARFAAALVARL